MTAPNKKIFPLGLKSARIYKLDASGYPAATSTSPYDGVLLGGPTAMTLETAQRVQVAHPGNDGVLQYDSLPSQDPTSGTFSCSRIDLDTLEILTGAKVVVEGEANAILRMTDTEQAGLVDVGLVVYRQAKQSSGNTRTWNTRVFPAVQLAPQNDGMQRDRQDPTNYNVTLGVSTKDLTGRAFTTATDGAKTGVYRDIESNGRIHYVGFKADGTEDEFVFNTDLPAADTATMNVYINGTERTTNLTKATTKVTFTTSLPSSGDMIVVRYQLASTAVDQD